MEKHGARPAAPLPPRGGAHPPAAPRRAREGAAEGALLLLVGLLGLGALILREGGPTRPPADTGDSGAIDSGAPDSGGAADAGGADAGAADAGATDSAAPEPEASCDTGACAELAETSGSDLAGEKGGFGCSAAPRAPSALAALGLMALAAARRRR